MAVQAVNPELEEFPLSTLARRGSRRALFMALERALMRETTRGLAIAVVVLLATAASLAVLKPVAPLGDELKLTGLGVAAAFLATGLVMGVKRGLERRTTLLEAAFAIDRSLRLDGALPAAMELEARASTGGFARLAVATAVQRLREAPLALVIARAIPRTSPPEWVAAPLLAIATGVLAFLVATRPSIPEPWPLAPSAAPRPASEKRDLARAAAVLRRAEVTLSREARDVEAELGVPGAASRALEELDHEARRLARGTQTAAGALAGIAGARGRIEARASRAAGLGPALEAAGAALASAPATAALARALEAGDTRQVRELGRNLAEQLRCGALTEDARAQVATAASRAGRALEGTSAGSDARASLESLGRSLEQPKSPEGQAEAATDAAETLAQARSQAAADQVAQHALDALDEARDAARGHPRGDEASRPGEGGRANGDPRAGDKAPPSTEDGALAHKGAGSQPGQSGGSGSSAQREGTQPGSGSGADERPGRRGDPAGSGLGSHVAGKGGTNEEGTPDPSEPANATAPAGPSSTLAGLLGSRGASAIFAVRGLARGGALEARSSGVVQEYRRTEEEALEREPVPVDQRRLVRRYFESIGGSDR